MGTRSLKCLSFTFGLVLTACGWIEKPVPTLTIPPTHVVEMQNVTPRVTRVVNERPAVTAGVSHVVKETVIVVTTVGPYDVSPSVSMMKPRAQHTATRLVDGRVLIVGGRKSAHDLLADVEIFNPESGAILPVAPLHTARHAHSATLLMDGRVLVVGGSKLNGGWLGDAELYDPSTNTWEVLPPLFSHGVEHTATLMKDGRVLVVGGAIGSGLITQQVEIFDPRNTSWTEAKTLEYPRASHTAQLLEDGRVLVAGGGGATGQPTGGDALIYDPQADQWNNTGTMITPRIMAKSVRLLDGRVLVAGGMSLKDAAKTGTARKVSSSSEIYDPDTNTWQAVDNLAQPRYNPVMEMLTDGRVLMIGGARDWECCYTGNSFVREVELFDPTTRRWSVVDKLPLPGVYMAGAALQDGQVWVTGGAGGPSGAVFRPNTWLITVMSTRQ